MILLRFFTRNHKNDVDAKDHAYMKSRVLTSSSDALNVIPKPLASNPLDRLRTLINYVDDPSTTASQPTVAISNNNHSIGRRPSLNPNSSIVISSISESSKDVSRPNEESNSKKEVEQESNIDNLAPFPLSSASNANRTVNNTSRSSIDNDGISAKHRNMTGLSTRSQYTSPNELHELIQKAIAYHENDELEMAFRLFCITALQRMPIGLFLSGLSLRHGWGCKPDQELALACLQYSADFALDMLKSIRAAVEEEAPSTNGTMKRSSKDEGLKSMSLNRRPSRPSVPIFSARARISSSNTTIRFLPESQLNSQNRILAQIAKHELSMSLYEIGQSYRFGWGIKRSKTRAVFYYKIAADLGDADSQMDLAQCYLNGQGIKKDRYMAASYYRIAALQGRYEFGSSWIYKEKYDQFFQVNFSKFVELEKKSNNTDNEQPASTVNTISTTRDKTSISYLREMDNFMQKAMSESE